MLRRLLALVAVLLVVPATAQAAVRATPCGTTPGLLCSEVEVPLDRSGATGGTVSLHVEELPAAGFSRGVAFLIAGGPGQGSARAYSLGSPDGAAFLRFLLPGYTLVAFDNRGTGASGVLRCPALQASTTNSPDAGAALAARCAADIGPGRAFYATRDHAEDMESVRRALGVPKIALFGVSYGTKLALAYALAHPDHVERLLLDSVVRADLPDPFETNVLRELPGTLASVCARGACRAATPDFAADVVALANRLAVRPVRGVVLGPGGGRKTVRMTGEDLLSTVIETDLSPGLSAALPAAVRSARGGNTRPLLRLFDLTERGSIQSPTDLSFGLYAATNCADGLFPWAPDTPIGARPQLIDAAIAALPPGALGPFGAWAARSGTAVFCSQWPSPAGHAPLGPGPLPNVPMLAISGASDLRTPTASAQDVTRLFPQGRLLVVPGVGHSVLTTDFSLCAPNAVRSWLADGPVLSACPRVPPFVSTLGAYPRAPGRRTAPATLAVAAKTIRDGLATWFEVALGGVAPAAGLYGGKLVPARSQPAFRLVGYSLAPGVKLTGRLQIVRGLLPLGVSGSVRVSGPAAAAGTIRVTRRALSGTLGGRRVSGRP